MIDPVTAVATATACFNGVKKLIEAGREVEDVFGQLGKWYGAVDDFKFCEKQASNPPIFKRIVNSKSVEQEALEIYAHKKKIEAQEKEIRELIVWCYGTGGWQEVVQIRRQIKAEREKTVYRQIERRQNLIYGTLAITLLGGIIVLMYYMLHLLL